MALVLPTIPEIQKKPTLSLYALIAFINLLVFPFVPLFVFLRFVCRIKFIRLRSDRIGHFAANTEEFLREVNAGKRQKLQYIALAPSKVANEALLQMWKRYLTIVQFRQPSFIRYIIKLLATRSFLSITDCFEAIPFKEDNHLWNTEKPVITLTPAENSDGKTLLTKMNVQGWFIGFHARDSSYLGTQWKKGDWQHTHRNCSIDNFLEAARYISAHGGYALRMGSVVEKKLTDLKDDHIIDYATTSRTEFGDLYLMNKCKFFIGTTAGLVCVSYIFNVPNITTNLQLLAIPPVGKHDLFIPKKVWYKPEQRFLTFKEMIDNSVLQFMSAEDFEHYGLLFIENTPEEILAVTKEMNERIDGTWKDTAEDEKLQKAFKSLYVQGTYCFGPPAARIGAQFLRDNKNLLG